MYTVQELVERCFPNGAIIYGDSSSLIEGVCDLKTATISHISFFSNDRYLQDFKRSLAGAIILTQEAYNNHHASRDTPCTYIIHETPSFGFQEVITLFFGGNKPILTGFTDIHPTAVVHPTAKIGKNVTIGPYVVIDAESYIGDNTMILPHVYIGRGVRLGVSSIIHAHSVIREGSLLGDRVIIQPGAIIGSCGFGYTTDASYKHIKLEHWGVVEIGDDVEIGANTTVDRGRFQATKIGSGTKIDNLCQIAHNVIIGNHSIIISQVGIAGSTKIGNYCVLAGKVAVNGHVEITSGVTIAGCSAVMKSILKPGVYSGVPVQEVSVHNKNAVYLRRVSSLFKRVEQLEKMVKTPSDSTSS